METKREPHLVDKHVGNRVRLRRLEMGWTQSKLGDALGLSFQQVQKYEGGTNRIGASCLQNVSDILKVPVAFFFEGLERSSSSKDSNTYPDFLPTSEALSLVKAFMNIRERRIRHRIIALVEQIGKSLGSRR